MGHFTHAQHFLFVLDSKSSSDPVVASVTLAKLMMLLVRQKSSAMYKSRDLRVINTLLCKGGI